MSTPFVAASSVAIVPVPTLPHRGLDPVNASSSTSFDDEKPEIVNSAAAVEDSRDGLVHGHVLKDGKRVYISWTKEEERRVVRKADFFLLPVLVVSLFSSLTEDWADRCDAQLLFFWMALDRSNVSGVLTSSFLRDTGMTRDQANTGTSIVSLSPGTSSSLLAKFTLCLFAALARDWYAASPMSAFARLLAHPFHSCL